MRARDDEPVVMSDSSSASFPNADIAGWGDGFDDLPFERQWEAAMAGLRRERPWAQITPENLASTSFAENVTVYDLLAPDRDERVRAVADRHVSA